MWRRHFIAAAAAAFAGFGLIILAAPGLAQERLHVRGTLTAVDGQNLTVQTSRGSETFTLVETPRIFIVTPADLSSVTTGRFVGITSVEQDGKRVAKEVHVFNEALRGLGEGHYPWDLEVGPNMMTNANIAEVEAVGGDRVLKLNYKDGEQTIAVPPSATIVAFDKAGPDQVVAGRQVFLVVQKAADGGKVAAVVVGAEGVKPPM
jgi:hypothetical protein